jgi:hypothetical protein
MNGSIPKFRYDGMVGDYGTVAAEAWSHMQNGLIAYYVWGNANQERTRAEQSFVVDPLNLHKGGYLITGFCVFCHVNGVQSAPNDIWTALEGGKITGGNQARLKEFWTSNDVLYEKYDEDRDIYQRAVRKIVIGISDGDAAFNKSVILGTNEREPSYYLTSIISKSRDDGVIANGNASKERALKSRGRR